AGFCFQAEDGIRDFHVTGVQTCALPIYEASSISSVRPSRLSPINTSRRSSLSVSVGTKTPTSDASDASRSIWQITASETAGLIRSEERRVGKDGSSRGAAKRDTGRNVWL